MDIYVQIKNKKGEVFKVVNFGRDDYFEFFKKHIGEIKGEKDFPIFFTEFKINNYLDVKKVKQLREEIKNIAGLIGKDIEQYRELLEKRARIEADILNHSSLKNLMIIGANRLEEMGDEIGETGIDNQLKVIREEICKLDENELFLDRERDKLKMLFDVELLFDILQESIKSSSGIYIKN
jgi:hypothetical protein